MLARLTLPLALLFAACGTDPTPLPTDDTDPSSLSCENVPLGTCASTPGCATIDGVELVEGPKGLCYRDTIAPAPLGCHDADNACPAVELVVSSSNDGAPYLVSSGCVPNGYSALPIDVPDACPTQEQARCEDIGPETCTDRTDCALISGRALSTDANGDCEDPAAPLVGLGCHPAETPCGDAISYGMADEEGDIYWFADTCLPEDWTSVTGPFPECV